MTARYCRIPSQTSAGTCRNERIGSSRRNTAAFKKGNGQDQIKGVADGGFQRLFVAFSLIDRKKGAGAHAQPQKDRS